MKAKVVVGLTGGIASGKSSVLKEFKRLGAAVLDSDAIAREVVQAGKPALRKIVRAFGKGILKPNGTLDRAKLGSMVFSNPRQRQQLQKITHPEIVRILKKRIAAARRSVVVADIPLLFESKLEHLVDRTVVVWAPPAKQTARLMKRSGYSSGEALRRIRAQWPLSRKRKLADFVIDNSGSLASTLSQTRKLWTSFTPSR